MRLIKNSPTPDPLPCGCCHCGCLCPQHSADRVAVPCIFHMDTSITRFLAEEAASLVALALLIAVAGVWAAILAGA